MVDRSSELEAEYCPPLDGALVQAILLDFDLSTAQGLEDAKGTLDALRASADAEALTGFDASGATHSLDDGASVSEAQTQSTDTDLTSLSRGLGQVQVSDGTSEGQQHSDVELENLGRDTKRDLLMQLFPGLGEFSVSHTLNKVNGNWQRALDELLNIAAFADKDTAEEGRFRAKGIEAFSEDQVGRRGRRKKRKGGSNGIHAGRRASSLSLENGEVQPVTNKWQAASSDIHFITVHTKLSDMLVRSAYYANNASMPKTIAHLLKDLMQSTSKLTSSDPHTQEYAVELGRDFPTIAPAYLTALIQLTHPSTASAHELAKALVKRPSTASSTTQIIPQYTAPSLSDDETSSLPSPQIIQSTGDARSIAATSRANQARLSAQAASAYRRSRSNHLYGGAASYYSQASRDAASTAVAHTSAAADTLVASQSSSEQLDLHGTTVADAVRIASRETRTWWGALGESKVNGRVGAGDREKGFRIVVGQGRHSEGGRGKLGPAVLKALTAEGWRVERGEGVLVVRGKIKK